jgi:hypothetical protein
MCETKYMWIIDKIRKKSQPQPLEFNLYRFYTEQGNDATIGRLYQKIKHYEKPICYTLERPKYFNGLTNYSDKPNTTINESCCIPAGRYKCEMTYSPRFKKDLYLVLKVKNREGVRLHAGNSINDIEGCIIFGERLVKNFNGFKYWLADSLKSFNNFYNITEKKPIILNIIDNDQEFNLSKITIE